MKKSIFIFSGLGADERVFQKLDLSNFEVIYIKWIIPRADETIEEYASRLVCQITEKKPILIGLSFGGIMAIEVSKQIETEKILLISSVKTRKEIPFYFRFAGKLRLNKFIPAKILKNANFMTNWFFGTSSNFDKEILQQILRETDPIFLKWAIDRLLHWSHNQVMENIFHLHGTKDRILPSRYLKCDVLVEGGGHLMVLNKATQVSEILNNHLNLIVENHELNKNGYGA